MAPLPAMHVCFTVLPYFSSDSDLESLRNALMKTTLESHVKPLPKVPGNCSAPSPYACVKHDL